MDKILITLKAGNQSHAVLCIPTIENALKYAKTNGLPGDTISLLDGRFVKDDDTFHYLAAKEEVFELKTTIWPVELEEKTEFNKATTQPRKKNQHTDDMMQFENHAKIEFVKIEPSELLASTSKCSNESICYEDSQNSCDTMSFTNHNEQKNAIEDSSDHELSQSSSDILSFGNFPEDMSEDALKLSFGSAQWLKFKNFQIPILKFPCAVLKLLQEKKPLGKHLQSVATVIVRELREISTHPPMAALRQITKQFSDMYPESFFERNSSGVITSSIPLGLITKMKNHNCYLNRSMQDGDKPTIEPPAKRSKSCNIFESTCINWNPPVTTEESNRLTPLALKLRSCEASSADFTSDLEECFPLIRMYLNKNMPSIDSIRLEWPILLIPKYAFLHFKQLNEFDIRRICTIFSEKQDVLYEYMKTGVRNLTIRQNVEKTTFSMLWHIFQYFKEDMELCCKFFNADTPLDNIEPPTETPWAAILKDKGCHTIAYIFLGKQIVSKVENYELMEVFALLIAYCYNFNIKYPRSTTQSMEFIVRYFGKYQSEEFRGYKSAVSEKSKVLNLLASL